MLLIGQRFILSILILLSMVLFGCGNFVVVDYECICSPDNPSDPELATCFDLSLNTEIDPESIPGDFTDYCAGVTSSSNSNQNSNQDSSPQQNSQNPSAPNQGSGSTAESEVVEAGIQEHYEPEDLIVPEDERRSANSPGEETIVVENPNVVPENPDSKNLLTGMTVSLPDDQNEGVDVTDICTVEEARQGATCSFEENARSRLTAYAIADGTFTRTGICVFGKNGATKCDTAFAAKYEKTGSAQNGYYDLCESETLSKDAFNGMVCDSNSLSAGFSSNGYCYNGACKECYFDNHCQQGFVCTQGTCNQVNGSNITSSMQYYPKNLGILSKRYLEIDASYLEDMNPDLDINENYMVQISSNPVWADDGLGIFLGLNKKNDFFGWKYLFHSVVNEDIGRSERLAPPDWFPQNPSIANSGKLDKTKGYVTSEDSPDYAYFNEEYIYDIDYQNDDVLRTYRVNKMEKKRFLEIYTAVYDPFITSHPPLSAGNYYIHLLDPNGNLAVENVLEINIPDQTCSLIHGNAKSSNLDLVLIGDGYVDDFYFYQALFDGNFRPADLFEGSASDSIIDEYRNKINIWGINKVSGLECELKKPNWLAELLSGEDREIVDCNQDAAEAISSHCGESDINIVVSPLEGTSNSGGMPTYVESLVSQENLFITLNALLLDSGLPIIGTAWGVYQKTDMEKMYDLQFSLDSVSNTHINMYEGAGRSFWHEVGHSFVGLIDYYMFDSECVDHPCRMCSSTYDFSDEQYCRDAYYVVEEFNKGGYCDGIVEVSNIYPNPFNPNEDDYAKVQIRPIYNFPEDEIPTYCYATLNVYEMTTGQLIKTYVSDVPISPDMYGPFTDENKPEMKNYIFKWDGKNMHGNTVASGRYTFQVGMKNTVTNTNEGKPLKMVLQK